MSHIVAFPELTGEQLVDLQRLLRSRSTPAGVHRRAILIWELAAASSLVEAGEAAALHYTNAHRWVRRFLASGVKGLTDRTRSGRPPDYAAGATSEILKVATAHPEDGIVGCMDELGPLQTIPRGGHDWGRRAARRPDRYKRNGTVQLLAAFAPHCGHGVGQAVPRKTGEAILEFLQTIVLPEFPH